ncbi:hypothetical protein JCGZ_15230 [Jatropha curcas]|uniref:Aminotransferase-like plant mobile domain-containing protein n=1 Tax=Jatropha curcas TaxID=180498 RepID=A0A067K643_JATCU|nr:hypothetical protein JCGZ_15230 [Jatropha curcas]
MSQISEIPASAYTPEMEILGALLDIPTFDGEPVPVSRNPLTPGTRPLQLLPLPGTELPVRYEMIRMPGFQSELVRSLLVVSTQTRYTVQGCMSYEMVFRFWAERIRTRLEAWRELPEEARPAAPAYGLMSTVSIRVVRVATPRASPGGFLAIWPTAITLMPVARIPSTSGASLMIGSCPM